MRKKRRYEATHGKEWVPVTPADRMPYRDEDFEMTDGKAMNRDGRGRGARGARGKFPYLCVERGPCLCV